MPLWKRTHVIEYSQQRFLYCRLCVLCGWKVVYLSFIIALQTTHIWVWNLTLMLRGVSACTKVSKLMIRHLRKQFVGWTQWWTSCMAVHLRGMKAWHIDRNFWEEHQHHYQESLVWKWCENHEIGNFDFISFPYMRPGIISWLMRVGTGWNHYDMLKPTCL